MKDTRREISSADHRSRAEAKTLQATRRLHAATEELLDAAAERYGINRNDLRCLEILEREGPMRPGGLAEASGLSPAAITKVLDRLERAGYVTRSEGPDRRSRSIQTSDRHRSDREATWKPVVEAATTAMADHGPEQLESFAELLEALAEANRKSAERLRAAR